jgi:hypothetical protein
VQISKVHFKQKEFRSNLYFGGNAQGGSDLIVACRAGETPPRKGQLPQDRVYSRSDLISVHNWALKSNWRGYLEPQQHATRTSANSQGAPRGVSWQCCTSAAELTRKPAVGAGGGDSSGELVCFGGRFSEESVIRFHRDREKVIAELQQQARAEKYMPSRVKAAKRREGQSGVATSRAVRLVMTDVNCERSSGGGIMPDAPAQDSPASVAIAVHHQSVAIFRAQVTTGRCYILTALARSCGGSEDSSSLDALDMPVLHTTAGTTLTAVDEPPSTSSSWTSPEPMRRADADADGASLNSLRALTVYEVIHLSGTLAGVGLGRVADPTRSETWGTSASITPLGHRPIAGISTGSPPAAASSSSSSARWDDNASEEIVIEKAADTLAHATSPSDEDDEQSQTLSLDSAVLESADSDSDEDVHAAGSNLRDSSSEMEEETMQMASASQSGETKDGGQQASNTRLLAPLDGAAATAALGADGRLRCTAYVSSLDFEAPAPPASAPGGPLPGILEPPDGAGDDDRGGAGWHSLLRWRCDRSDCAREVPLTASHKTSGRAASGCDRCGGAVSLSLREMTMVLSDCPRDCKTASHKSNAAPERLSDSSEFGHGHGHGSRGASFEPLAVAVLPCAVPSLFCGLVTPEQVYGGHGISPHSDDLGRAQVREAIWALCNSGTRLTFVLEDRTPAVACTDSQGYGIKHSSSVGGVGMPRYAVAGIDWASLLQSPLDWSCGCSAG